MSNLLEKAAKRLLLISRAEHIPLRRDHSCYQKSNPVLIAS